MNVPGLPTIAASLLAVGSIGGAALTADSRYVKASDFEQYLERDAREELRDLEREIREIDDPEIRELLEDEYDELLEEYCLTYEDERRCE